VSGKREADDGRFLLPARQGEGERERERERDRERGREADRWWTKTKEDGGGGKKRRNIEQEKDGPTGERIKERCCSSSALCMVQCGAVLKGERMAWMDFACILP